MTETLKGILEKHCLEQRIHQFGYGALISLYHPAY